MSDREHRGSRDDPLDDIDFEEFELREPADWDDVEQTRQYEFSEYMLACPSCGIDQDAANRHCEQCGARLGQRRIAVASRPLRSVNAGGRALGIIVVVIALSVVAALVISAVRNGGDEGNGGVAATDGSSTTERETTTTRGQIQDIKPISIECSSQYNATLRCANLIDGLEDYWNDESLRGEDAWIRITFVNPIAFQQIQIINVSNEEKFRRNYRVRAVEVYADDLPGVPFRGDIPNDNDRPHRVAVETNATTELDIRIIATWPSEALGGEQAFDELAIEELIFWGYEQQTDPLESGEPG